MSSGLTAKSSESFDVGTAHGLKLHKNRIAELIFQSGNEILQVNDRVSMSYFQYMEN